jgi:hypothetical protein
LRFLAAPTVQAALGYNNTDGSTYVLINDAPPTTDAAVAAAPDLDALFSAAKEQNYTTAQWIAASASKADASKWRRLITWPFGEKGGVFRFNKQGNGLYIVTSIDRWDRACCVSTWQQQAVQQPTQHITMSTRDAR